MTDSSHCAATIYIGLNLRRTPIDNQLDSIGSIPIDRFVKNVGGKLFCNRSGRYDAEINNAWGMLKESDVPLIR